MSKRGAGIFACAANLLITLHGSGQSGKDNQAQMGGVTGIFTDAEHSGVEPVLHDRPPVSGLGNWLEQ